MTRWQENPEPQHPLMALALILACVGAVAVLFGYVHALAWVADDGPRRLVEGLIR